MATQALDRAQFTKTEPKVAIKLPNSLTGDVLKQFAKYAALAFLSL